MVAEISVRQLDAESESSVQELETEPEVENGLCVQGVHELNSSPAGVKLLAPQADLQKKKEPDMRPELWEGKERATSTEQNSQLFALDRLGKSLDGHAKARGPGMTANNEKSDTQSMALEIKRPADSVVQNFRPSALGRFGKSLDERLQASRRRIATKSLDPQPELSKEKELGISYHNPQPSTLETLSLKRLGKSLDDRAANRGRRMADNKAGREAGPLGDGRTFAGHLEDAPEPWPLIQGGFPRIPLGRSTWSPVPPDRRSPTQALRVPRHVPLSQSRVEYGLGSPRPRFLALPSLQGSSPAQSRSFASASRQSPSAPERIHPSSSYPKLPATLANVPVQVSDHDMTGSFHPERRSVLSSYQSSTISPDRDQIVIQEAPSRFGPEEQVQLDAGPPNSAQGMNPTTRRDVHISPKTQTGFSGRFRPSPREHHPSVRPNHHTIGHLPSDNAPLSGQLYGQNSVHPMNYSQTGSYHPRMHPQPWSLPLPQSPLVGWRGNIRMDGR